LSFGRQDFLSGIVETNLNQTSIFLLPGLNLSSKSRHSK
jgi:hypothetical protein